MNIELKYGKTNALIATKGAQMISFNGNNGREVIWQADPKVWASHAPVLFPVLGMVKEGKVVIDNVAYPMTKHGFCRDAEFEIAKRGEGFVDLVLRANDSTRVMYPFDFEFHVIYTLFDNGFRTDFVTENKSDKSMPFNVGGHPAFIVPMEDGAAYTDYQLVFPCKEEGRSLLVGTGYVDGAEIIPLDGGTTLPLKHDWFDEKDTLVFADMNSRSVDLVHKVSGKGLRISYPKMEVLAVWSKPVTHGDYVCLEPWHGLPSLANESGKFEEKPYVTLLAPGMSHLCGYTVELL